MTDLIQFRKERASPGCGDGGLSSVEGGLRVAVGSEAGGSCNHFSLIVPNLLETSLMGKRCSGFGMRMPFEEGLLYSGCRSCQMFLQSSVRSSSCLWLYASLNHLSTPGFKTKTLCRSRVFSCRSNLVVFVLISGFLEKNQLRFSTLSL
jgi:hypothetical protein